MRRRVLAVAAALCVLASAPSLAQAPAKPVDVPAGWQRFAPADGRFSVLLPGTPETRPPTSDTAGTYHTFTLARPGFAFVVAYNVPNYDMTDPQTELTSNRDSFIRTLMASRVSEHRFSSTQPVGQVPAIEFTCENAEWECRSRTFILTRRGYQVAVLIRRGTVSSVDVSRFLDSFQILP